MTSTAEGWRRLAVVVGVVLLFYLALLPRWIERLDPLTGDEPFYVMTAISITRDGDLNEMNNYDSVTVQYANWDFTLYEFDDAISPPNPLPPDWKGWPRPLRYVEPHAATTDLEGYYTKHGLGLSFLIAIPYEVAGRVGADLLIMVFGALLAGQMYLLAREVGLEPLPSQMLAVALAVAMPIGPYAMLIFPAVPTALMLVYAVRRIAADQNSTHQWALVGLCVGGLPWMHQRFASAAIVLSVVLILILLSRRSVTSAVAALVPLGVLALSLITYNYWLYGQIVQPVVDHAGFHMPTKTLNAAAGLLLDAQWGLFIAAPVMALALVVTPHWVQRAPRVALLAIAAAVPYVATISAYRVWWGEWGPPARYLVPLAPFAAGALAAWLAGGGRGRWVAFGSLWLVGGVFTLLGYVHPQRFYHHPDGRNNLVSYFDEVTGTSLQELLVAFQPHAAAPLDARVWLAVWTAAALLAFAALLNFGLLHGARRATNDPRSGP